MYRVILVQSLWLSRCKCGIVRFSKEDDDDDYDEAPLYYSRLLNKRNPWVNVPPMKKIIFDNLEMRLLEFLAY